MKKDTIDEALEALRDCTNTTDRLLLERAALRAIKQRLQRLAEQVGALGKAVTP